MNAKHGRIGRAALLVLILLVAGQPEAAGQSTPSVSKTFVVVGKSLVPKAGVDAAKTNAIADGKRLAVEQMTAELLALDVLIQQFPAIDAAIYDEADTFIQYYKVLNETRQDNQVHVLLQARVSGQLIEARLQSAGILSTDPRPMAQLSLSVVGTDNLSNFVQFRGTLNQVAGVESVQISEILPNRTTLAVDYRGTASAFAEALLRQPREGFSMRVYQESDSAFRIDLAPAEPTPGQD